VSRMKSKLPRCRCISAAFGARAAGWLPARVPSSRSRPRRPVRRDYECLQRPSSRSASPSCSPSLRPLQVWPLAGPGH
jgi:hypothetical protein